MNVLMAEQYVRQHNEALRSQAERARLIRSLRASRRAADRPPAQ